MLIGRSARQGEQQRAQAQEHSRTYVQEGRKISDTGAAGADAAGPRLRDEGFKLASAVSCPGTDTASIARDQTAIRAATVRSKLLARADGRAGELAKAYDRARLAGDARESSYNALMR